MQRNCVDLITGAASFLDDHRLVVESSKEKDVYSADQIVIATGTSPAHSDKIPLDGSSIVDSDMFLCISSLPRSITIVGAGVIGVEYACMTAALGISTTLVEAREDMLEFLDSEIVEALRYHMRDMGITLRFGEEVVSVRKNSRRSRCRRAEKPQGNSLPSTPLHGRPKGEYSQPQPRGCRPPSRQSWPHSS